MVNSRHAFSLVELMLVAALTAFLTAAVFGLLGNAQTNFFNADASIDLRNSMRLASEKISMELRNTGYKSAVPQFSILDNTGVGGSDIIRFSIPILCTTTATLLDSSGNPAYWGAPKTWGCDASTCMDANNNCAIQEYKYVQYALNSSNQLERKILDTVLGTVSGTTTIVGQNITNLQATISSNQMTVILSGQKISAVKKTLTMSYTNKVFLNNFGG